MKNRFLATGILLIISLWGLNTADAIGIGKVLLTPELKQAWLFLEMKEYRLADEALKGCYLKADDVGAACSFIRARILDGQKKQLGAVDAYRKAFMFSKDEEVRKESLFRKSELLYEKNFSSEAQKGLAEYLKLFPNAKNVQKANLYLARSLAGSNKLEEALAAFEKAGNGAVALYGKADVLQRIGKTKEANDTYEKAVKSDPDFMAKNDQTRYLYAENLQQTGNVAKAKDVLKLVTDAKLKEKADLAIGTIEADASKNAEAAMYLARAANAKNRDVKLRALMRLAHVQAAMGKSADAQKTIDVLRKLFIGGKDKEDIDFLTIDLRVKEKDYKEAAKILRAMIKKNPNSRELVQKLEAVLKESAEADKEQFASLWKSYGKTFMNPFYDQLILKAAGIFKENGGKTYLELLQWIKDNSVSDKERQNALYALSEHYADKGDKAMAVKYLGQLKQYKVSADDILRSEAKVFYESGDLKDVYERMAAIKHVSSDDLPLLRESISEAPDKQKALAHYEQVLKGLGGESGDAMTLAENLYQLGKKDEAVFYYKRVLDKDPSNEWALYRLGTMLSGEDAKDALKKLSAGNSRLSKFAKSVIQGDTVNKQLEEMP